MSFEPNFQVCEQGALCLDLLFKYDAFQDFCPFLIAHFLHEVSTVPFVFNLVEGELVQDNDPESSVHPDFEFIPRFGQPDHRVDPGSQGGKAQKPIGLHHVKRTEQAAICVFLLLQDIDCGQPGLEPNHINRFGELVVDLAPWAVDEHIEFDRAHNLILMPNRGLASDHTLQCYNLFKISC
jgi:hypothetical protein